MSSTYSIDLNRWAKLDIFNQMGNIYSEVGRSIKTRGRPDTQEHDQAVARTIDLFDATIETLVNAKSAKAKEVLLAKEQFLEVIADDAATQESVQSLDRYFMQFAVAARLNR